MDQIETTRLVCDIVVANSLNNNLHEKLKRLSTDDWSAVYDFSRKYNLVPLLYFKLKSLKLFDDALITKDIKSNLRAYYASSAAESLKSSVELEKILKLLQESNIDCILLKGAYLAKKYYEYPGARPMCDIDILVNRNNIDKAAKILLMQNYCVSSRLEYEQNYNADNFKSWEAMAKHMPDFVKDNYKPIEVHWTLFANSTAENDQIIHNIWKRAGTTCLYDVSCCEMCTEDLIIYLCYHIGEDGFKQKLLQLYDIYLVLNKTEINWIKFLTIVEEWQIEKIVLCCFKAIKALFNAENIDVIINKLLNYTQMPVDIEVILLDIFTGDIACCSAEENKMIKFMKSKGLLGEIRSCLHLAFNRKRVEFHYGLESGSFKYYFYSFKRFFALIRTYWGSYVELYVKNRGKAKKMLDNYQGNDLILQDWLRK